MKKILSFLAAFVFFVTAFASAHASSVIFAKNLSYGTAGTEVSQLQQFLADEGLYSGSVNATYGASTKTAVVAFQKQESIKADGSFGAITRSHANTIAAAHPDWLTTLSTTKTYQNVNNDTVQRPATSSNGIPAGATAECRDGTYSFSLHHSGSCSHHGGVSNWLN